MLKKYVRDNNNRRVGVLVGLRPEGSNSFLVGLSRCAPQDRFDPEYGTEMATSRATKWHERGLKLDNLEDILDTFTAPMKYEFWCFVDRCKKYYKDCAPAPYLTAALGE